MAIQVLIYFDVPIIEPDDNRNIILVDGRLKDGWPIFIDEFVDNVLFTGVQSSRNTAEIICKKWPGAFDINEYLNGAIVNTTEKLDDTIHIDKMIGWEMTIAILIFNHNNFRITLKVQADDVNPIIKTLSIEYVNKQTTNLNATASKPASKCQRWRRISSYLYNIDSIKAVPYKHVIWVATGATNPNAMAAAGWASGANINWAAPVADAISSVFLRYF